MKNLIPLFFIVIMANAYADIETSAKVTITNIFVVNENSGDALAGMARIDVNATGDNSFYVEANNDIGKNILALLISAYMNDKQVVIRYDDSPSELLTERGRIVWVGFNN